LEKQWDKPGRPLLNDFGEKILRPPYKPGPKSLLTTGKIEIPIQIYLRRKTPYQGDC